MDLGIGPDVAADVASVVIDMTVLADTCDEARWLFAASAGTRHTGLPFDCSEEVNPTQDGSAGEDARSTDTSSLNPKR